MKIRAVSAFFTNDIACLVFTCHFSAGLFSVILLPLPRTVISKTGNIFRVKQMVTNSITVLLIFLLIFYRGLIDSCCSFVVKYTHLSKVAMYNIPISQYRVSSSILAKFGVIS